MPSPQDPPRMTPVDMWRVLVARMLQAVLLPEFVGVQHRDDEKRQYEKDAQYHLLDHDCLHRGAGNPQFILGSVSKPAVIFHRRIPRCTPRLHGCPYCPHAAPE
ncbi:hypothetical protein E4F39_18700 [Burkholderia pseudomallei]|nr:hypothetical protein [Burkholderia pseudomallei]MBM5586919.1 hypothetical protein [Burkholderia pseudomallei]MPT60675.1 hypothetical protein [Burkholderia pseudomallei]MPT69397.1 hypothetical protein [Burkholderia pseudomallei]MPT75163.1 hypothetical protein [Burkholderia pseudomallei]